MDLDAGIRKSYSGATFVVAAADSHHKERADFVCSGVADQEVIETAINALVKSVSNEAISLIYEVFDNMDDPIVDGWAGLRGDETLSQDAVDYHEGTASLKIVGGSTDYPGAKLEGLASLEWGTYDLLTMWVKADTACVIRLFIYDSTGAWKHFEAKLSAAGTWEELFFDLDYPIATSGTLSWNDVVKISFHARSTTDSYTFRADFISLEKYSYLDYGPVHWHTDVITSNGTTYTRGTDYLIDDVSARIRAIPSGSIVSGDTQYIDYDYGGGTIQFLDGVYKPSSYIECGKDYITLKGTGKGTTFDMQNVYRYIWVYGSHVNIEDLNIVNCPNNNREAVIYVWNNGRDIEYVKISGVTAKHVGQGIRLQSRKVDDTYYDIRHSIIENCVFETIGTHAIECAGEVHQNVIIRNCFIKDAGRSEFGAGICVQSCVMYGILIDGCVIEKTGENGIHIESDVYNIVISNCIISEAGYYKEYNHGSGILVSGGTDTHPVITGCQLYECSGPGLWVYHGYITNCEIYGCGGGIKDAGTFQVVSNCIIKDCSYGYDMNDNSMISNSYITNCGSFGIDCGNRCVVANNIIEYAYAGVHMTGVSRCEITGNVCRYNDRSGIHLVNECEDNLIIGNFCYDNNADKSTHYSGILVGYYGACNDNYLVDNICKSYSPTTYPQEYGIKIRYGSGNHVRNNHVIDGGVSGGYSAASGNYARVTYLDTFLDVLGVSASHIRANQDLSTATPITFTLDAQPDAPRTLSAHFDSHVNITAYSITITGEDAKGITVTETKTEADGWDWETSNAFATITSIVMSSRTGTGVGDTMDIGITDVLGLCNDIFSTASVFKIKKNTENATVSTDQVDPTYDTYDMSVIGLSAGDNFTIWYRCSLNILS